MKKNILHKFSKIQRLQISELLFSLSLSLTLSLSSCKTEKTYPEPVEKPAMVCSDSVFTDKINIPVDDKGADITVMMAYNEPENILTLTLTSTRNLIGLRADTYYRTVFHKKLFGHRVMDPTKLTYPVLMQPNSTVYLDKKVHKAFLPPKSNHIFNAWLGGMSEELSLITPTVTSGDALETVLITDSIVQRFNVRPDATKASINLRSLLLVDGYNQLPPAGPFAAFTTPEPVKKTKRAKYNIICEKDLKLTYNIQIKRNPCFGLEYQRDSTLQLVYDITNAYRNLKKSCPTGEVETRAAQQIFNQHRQFLRSKYVESTDSSACPEVQANIREYNSYVDSIRTARCDFVPPVEDSPELSKVLRTGLAPQMLLDAAHRLDNTVAQYTLVTDVVQIHDLIMRGREIIRLMNRNIKEKGVVTTEQKTALAEYRRAEVYFRKVVLKQ